MDKIVVVRVSLRLKHPVFGKFIVYSSTYKANDKNTQYNEGDTVEIAEGRPISRDKSWMVVCLVNTPRVI